MTMLDDEELFRLHMLDVIAIRNEPIKPDDLAWLIARLYQLSEDATRTDEEHDACIDACEVESLECQLAEVREKLQNVTEDRDRLLVIAAGVKFTPDRLMFLRKSLRASLDAVERSLDNTAMVKRKVRKRHG